MRVATKTLEAIDAMVQADQGATYRGWLGRVIPHIEDAYRTDVFPFRNHMGASGIGNECPRKIWYGFRWVTKPNHGGRLLRLFNRGHLEEARFIALLLSIGCQVYQQDENGHQFAISHAGGHFGGSGDGIVVNCPDLAPGQAALSEFKTANDSKFKKFQKDGVKKTNWTYYVQMQVYMRKMAIAASLFMVVNKNNDELHAEIVEFDPEVADRYIDRGELLVFMAEPPTRIERASPGFFECKWCDHNKVCFGFNQAYKTCRSCKYVIVGADGGWYCNNGARCRPDQKLDKNQQLAGCDQYVPIHME